MASRDSLLLPQRLLALLFALHLQHLLRAVARRRRNGTTAVVQPSPKAVAAVASMATLDSVVVVATSSGSLPARIGIVVALGGVPRLVATRSSRAALHVSFDRLQAYGRRSTESTTTTTTTLALGVCGQRPTFAACR